MPHELWAKPDSPEQFKRCLQVARELDAGSDDDTVFERLLEGVARSKNPKPTPKNAVPEKAEGSR